jgi:hypothetical protein
MMGHPEVDERHGRGIALHGLATYGEALPSLTREQVVEIAAPLVVEATKIYLERLDEVTSQRERAESRLAHTDEQLMLAVEQLTVRVLNIADRVDWWLRTALLTTVALALAELLRRLLT